MQNIQLKLAAEPSKSMHANIAAQSCDLDVTKKLSHEISIDLPINYLDKQIIVITGKSGSGKTTFAKHIFSDWEWLNRVQNNEALIDCFGGLDYETKIKYLTSVGLNTVVNWLKPTNILSNGENERASVAIELAKRDKLIVDEFTSVLDRTVAKITAANVAKLCRNLGKQIVLISPHEDIVEFLEPDLYIDMNNQTATENVKKKVFYNLKSQNVVTMSGNILRNIII